MNRAALLWWIPMQPVLSAAFYSEHSLSLRGCLYFLINCRTLPEYRTRTVGLDFRKRFGIWKGKGGALVMEENVDRLPRLTASCWPFLILDFYYGRFCDGGSQALDISNCLYESGWLTVSLKIPLIRESSLLKTNVLNPFGVPAANLYSLCCFTRVQASQL